MQVQRLSVANVQPTRYVPPDDSDDEEPIRPARTVKRRGNTSHDRSKANEGRIGVAQPGKQKLGHAASRLVAKGAYTKVESIMPALMAESTALVKERGYAMYDGLFQHISLAVLRGVAQALSVQAGKKPPALKSRIHVIMALGSSEKRAYNVIQMVAQQDETFAAMLPPAGPSRDAVAQQLSQLMSADAVRACLKAQQAS